MSITTVHDFRRYVRGFMAYSQVKAAEFAVAAVSGPGTHVGGDGPRVGGRASPADGRHGPRAEAGGHWSEVRHAGI